MKAAAPQRELGLAKAEQFTEKLLHPHLALHLCGVIFKQRFNEAFHLWS
jgi:hypothetical protein